MSIHVRTIEAGKCRMVSMWLFFTAKRIQFITQLDKNYSAKRMFLCISLQHTVKQTYMGTNNTKQMPISVQNLLSTSDTMFNIILKCELDLTIFVQILEITPQYLHHTVHFVTTHTLYLFLQYQSPYLSVCVVYFLFISQTNHCII